MSKYIKCKCGKLVNKYVAHRHSCDITSNAVMAKKKSDLAKHYREARAKEQEERNSQEQRNVNSI